MATVPELWACSSAGGSRCKVAGHVRSIYSLSSWKGSFAIRQEQKRRLDMWHVTAQCRAVTWRSGITVGWWQSIFFFLSLSLMAGCKPARCCLSDVPCLNDAMLYGFYLKPSSHLNAMGARLPLNVFFLPVLHPGHIFIPGVNGLLLSAGDFNVFNVLGNVFGCTHFPLKPSPLTTFSNPLSYIPWTFLEFTWGGCGCEHKHFLFFYFFFYLGFTLPAAATVAMQP